MIIDEFEVDARLFMYVWAVGPVVRRSRIRIDSLVQVNIVRARSVLVENLQPVAYPRGPTGTIGPADFFPYGRNDHQTAFRPPTSWRG